VGALDHLQENQSELGAKKKHFCTPHTHTHTHIRRHHGQRPKVRGSNVQVEGWEVSPCRRIRLREGRHFQPLNVGNPPSGRGDGGGSILFRVKACSSGAIPPWVPFYKRLQKNHFVGMTRKEVFCVISRPRTSRCCISQLFWDLAGHHRRKDDEDDNHRRDGLENQNLDPVLIRERPERHKRVIQSISGQARLQKE
jgi:hypothetical protein